MKITFTQKGDWRKTTNFLTKLEKALYLNKLDKYGKQGVNALASATPIDSGLTAQSWSYKIEKLKDGVSISWYNDNMEDGVPIAILLQYGHGTNNGGYVQGRDYINPAIRPIFDKLADQVWKEVIKR